MALFDIQASLQMLREMGVVDFLLPFLLVFAIVYGVLDRAEVFGKKRHDINAIIALVIAFIFGMTSWAVEATTQFLPWIGLIAIAALGFLILLSMFAIFLQGQVNGIKLNIECLVISLIKHIGCVTCYKTTS